MFRSHVRETEGPSWENAPFGEATKELSYKTIEMTCHRAQIVVSLAENAIKNPYLY